MAAGKDDVDPAMFLDVIKESSDILGKFEDVILFGSLGGFGGPYILFIPSFADGIFLKAFLFTVLQLSVKYFCHFLKFWYF